MISRRHWLAATAAALLACSSGGKKDGGATPNAGPTSGGGGASTQVGSLLAHGGESLATGAPGRGGGFITLVSNRRNIVLGPTPGLAAKPGWTRPAVALGSNPRTFSASATVALTGALQGDDGATAATGLWVKPGVTLTLTPSSGTSGFLLDGPLVVEGTIDVGRAAAGSANAAALLVGSTLFVLAPTGRLLGRGEDRGAGQAGGNGGSMLLAGSGGIFLFGTIDATGGDGGAGGGNGGFVLAGFTPLPVPGATGFGGAAVLTGTVDVSGGDGGTQTGGRGGSFALGVNTFDPGGGGMLRAPKASRPDLPDDAAAYCSGTVDATGGGGVAGGAGGDIEVNGGLSTVVSGTLDASGGSVVAAASGGAGGNIGVGLWGGETWCEGTLDAAGGNSGAASAGQGGGVIVGAGAGLATEPLASPAVHFSADVDASGGTGNIGGEGGFADIVTDGDIFAVADAVDANASDGVGTGGGGAGGEIYIESSDGVGGFGPVTVSVLLVANGGGTDDGTGGPGGRISALGSAVTCGAAQANGGGSSVEFPGPDGGAIYVYSDDTSSVVTGPLSVRAGDGSEPGSHGTVNVDDVLMPLVNGVYTPP